jgi:hypothetical protein
MSKNITLRNDRFLIDVQENVHSTRALLNGGILAAGSRPVIANDSTDVLRWLNSRTHARLKESHEALTGRAICLLPVRQRGLLS